jgi:chaperonin GroEL (HSP60 family)
LITGATTLSSLIDLSSQSQFLGKANIEQKDISGTQLLFISSKQSKEKICTILLRGSSQQIIDEAQRVNNIASNFFIN